MQLYKISEEMNLLTEMYESGDIPDEAYADTLESIGMEFGQKAEQIAKIIRNFEGNNLAVKSELDRLQEISDCNSKQINHLKKYLFEQMKITGMEKFATELFKFSICKNGGLAPLEITGDVPQDYCKFEPDNAKIRMAIGTGQDVEFAKLGERGEHLRIK